MHQVYFLIHIVNMYEGAYLFVVSHIIIILDFVVLFKDAMAVLPDTHTL